MPLPVPSPARSARAAASAAALVLALGGLAACSDGGDDEPAAAEETPATQTLEDVTVTGEPGEEPVLEFEQPFTLAETDVQVLDEGDGPVVEEGQTVTVDYVGVNGRDGTEFDSSFDEDPVPFPLVEGGLIQGFLTGLVGQNVGSRVLLGITSEDGYAEGNPDAGIEVGDSLLFVVELQEASTPLSQAEGTPVPPQPGLPTVEVAEDGRPTVTVPQGPPPAELVVQPLVEGAGETVPEGGQVSANFTIVTWPGGEEVASSFEQGGPATIPLGAGAIPGFEQALVGSQVGDRLLVVVPPDQAFGAEGNEQLGVGGQDSLVIVVDVLDVG